MSVDVGRIPGQCKCGKHWYRFASARWIEMREDGAHELEKAPSCGNIPNEQGLHPDNRTSQR